MIFFSLMECGNNPQGDLKLRFSLDKVNFLHPEYIMSQRTFSVDKFSRAEMFL